MLFKPHPPSYSCLVVRHCVAQVYEYIHLGSVDLCVLCYLGIGLQYTWPISVMCVHNPMVDHKFLRHVNTTWLISTDNHMLEFIHELLCIRYPEWDGHCFGVWGNIIDQATTTPSFALVDAVVHAKWIDQTYKISRLKNIDEQIIAAL